jgi:hypothetical protein
MMKELKVVLSVLAVASFANWANASGELSIYDGVNPLITVFDNGAGDQSPATGAIFVQTNVGVWFLSISSAVTKPIFGSATDPVMSVFVQANSLSAGSLTFTFSDLSFGPATGILNATADGHVINGAPTTVLDDVYGDPRNVLGATTIHLASTGTAPLPTTVSGTGALNLAAPYSLTQVVTFVTSGETGFSSDISFNVIPVPEPGMMGLAALGLAACAFRRGRS